MIPFLLIVFYGLTLSGCWSLGKLAITACCGLWLALGQVYRRPVDAYLLAYLAVVAVTSSTSADPWLSVFGLWGTYNSGLLPALVLVPFWACVPKWDRPNIETGIRWGAALFAVIALFQFFILPEILPTGRRAYGTMGSPVYAGALACLCLPFCRGWLERGVLLAALWATGSRGAWLGAAIGMGYAHFPTLTRRWKFYALALPAVLILAAFAVRPVSDLGRVIVWHSAVDAFKQRPLLGWGTGNFLMVAQIFRNPLWDEAYGSTTQDHAHNLFLEAAATSGIVGIISLTVLLFCLWCTSNRTTQAALLGVGIVGMLNPLPIVVKALCLMLAASCVDGKPTFSKLHLFFVNTLAAKIFFVVAWLIHLDRMMTYYGQYPWSFSSIWAQYYSGVIKEIAVRWLFKF